MSRTVNAVDLFAGAGGTSTGLAHACQELDRSVNLVAVNHWPTAIESHKANHPWATHLCATVESLDPHEVVPGGVLDILVASPECRHFSVARGGRPKSDQLRASAWVILRWLELLRVESVLVENVPEFQSWGPLNQQDRPIRERSGETYRAWLQAMRSLGYNVDARVLNAADYGDPTTRRRLFVLARHGTKPIEWPTQTHSKGGKVKGTKRWRAAREVIDWSLLGESLFARKKPLSPNTWKRILYGLQKFGGPELRPFLISMVGRNLAPHSVEEPIPTILTRCDMGVVEPFVLSQASGGAPRSVDDPLPTMVGGGGGSIVRPFILPPLGYHFRDGKANRPRSVDEPFQTFTRRGGGHLVEPFIVPNFGERDGQEPRVHSVNEPLPAVTSHGAGALVEPYLVKYCRTGGAYSVDEPAPTVTTHERLALVQPVVNGRMLDIRFRMLQPHELAAAMGFDAGYKFVGNKGDVVRQIGNAVAVNMAKALCLSLLGTPSRYTLPVASVEGVKA